ncbi:GNAT family N-acetyltransferase [Quisquiliibacterium transsilvanicum]|uniref:Alpha-beta hydrolase superfamily lysophospholipase/predicted GNAT family N-acyltransferase n=1 Tax=Quisquiliibacterium transsilvanicum TaxID=1549638 RepID=A0A7W8M7X5_9BURK|nr:alpha-beta hydrolase superfamily lysophospholipase/predicted GNAT family N-acyltransferase [Quisquiliibacterium transsilvanicum]
MQVRTGDWATLGEPATRVRAEVFVREQGIPLERELDGQDPDCVHCVAWVDDAPVATGRLLADGHIGRMAVLAAHRGRGFGSLVLRGLLDAAASRGDAEVALAAQASAVGFYARHGFATEGRPFIEVGIEHHRMRRRLFAGAEGQAFGPAQDGAGLDADDAHDDDPGRVRAQANGLSAPRDRIEAMADGIGLHLCDWGEGRGRGVYLLHGLGEHVGRYDALARWFCARGWRVRGHDHAGHGRSGGRRGALRSERQLVEHARTLIEGFADTLGEPPLLLGHSMGGALAAQLVVCEGVPVRGLVLSSPALDTGIGAAQRALAALLYRLAPNLAIGNGLDPQALSHDAHVVRAYLEDPLVHDRISARLLRWLMSAGEGARRAAGSLAVPTLLQVAGADRLVNPEGSRAFARAAPEALLTMHWYEGLYHEIYNEQEADRRRVLTDLERWLGGLRSDALSPPS